MSDPRDILRELDGHPTPTDDQGRCWFCGGGLGHSEHGHRGDCPWVRMRKAADAAGGAAE